MAAPPSARVKFMPSVFFLLAALAWLLYNSPCHHKTPPTPPSVSPFNWHPCAENPLVECGTLLVRLNHLAPENGTFIKLALSRFRPNTTEPVLGSLLINPGGPGGSGKQVVLLGGKRLSSMVGDRYDIIGFDPRGIGESNSIKCLNLLSCILRINVGVTTFAKLQEAKAKSCGKWGIDVLPYVSTASVARDMDLIREALGEDVLNYYGFSYGTFLGTVYSQMFPDRVGRLAIDGVMDATTYVKSYAEFSLQYLINTDDIYKGFVKDCEAAGPSRCALASSDLKKHPVDKKVRSLLKSLEKDPVVVVEDITFPTIIGATEVLNLLFRGWYQPAIWPKIATALASLIDENDATAVAQLSSGGGGPSGDTCPIHDEAGSLGFLSVVCLDTAGNDHPLKKWEKIAKENTKNSEWFGEANTWQGLACKYWPVSASERYTGPWNNKLKNQILIIGNRYDPVTPLASAQIIEKQMEGNGVLLTREGYGHCSTSMVSKCTQEHIRRYFVDGIVPPKGTVCDTDFDVFPETNLLDAQSAEVLKNVEDIQMIHEMIVKSNVRRL
ncbi:alpha/beta-hydrolase [Rhizoclosmatium globosum]|uniref:Alpha/beta-hydrolase n=1 Tax=Rhizoclosmatium globosum TaxID=329046 RepID=A0A1Y2CV52_9FUNG|nr:alpha/beta-hydrolase [Rhizoclosmatium globosum]|eukprot:ORY50704.1 alpha/beta-hydrolase [Rhizoclosmatium globosum]